MNMGADPFSRVETKKEKRAKVRRRLQQSIHHPPKSCMPAGRSNAWFAVQIEEQRKKEAEQQRRTADVRRAGAGFGGRGRGRGEGRGGRGEHGLFASIASIWCDAACDHGQAVQPG